ncbi:ANTAR domain-containing protein [Streptomyces tauricus]|uniref:ANTAR domain-containing protein n=1 Tax=Streptomyces tauricus TaxID=68274 RepID=UPI00382A505D
MRPSERLYVWRGPAGEQSPAPAPHDDSSRSRRHDATGSRPFTPSGATLREEIAQLREALVRRPVIDMARGVLITVWSCTADEAWELLVDVSQHSNTKLYDLAEAILATVHGEPLPRLLQDHLAAAAARLRAR